MNWNKAIRQIEQALAVDKAVSVEYHRKWMKNDSHCSAVDSVVEYQWEGQICKAVNLYDYAISDQINEGSHIIDKVIIEER